MRDIETDEQMVVDREDPSNIIDISDDTDSGK